MPDSEDDSSGYPATGIQTGETSRDANYSADGSGRQAVESQNTIDPEWKGWEERVKPVDVARLRLQQRIAAFAAQLERMLDSTRTTDGVRDNYEMFRRMYELVLDTTGRAWTWTAENEKQAKNPNALVAGADWCGIFAAYVLTRAGRPTQWRMWNGPIESGILGPRKTTIGAIYEGQKDHVEVGDIAVLAFRTIWKDPYTPEKIRVEHHCVVIGVSPDGKTIKVVNGNAEGQRITISDVPISAVTYFYKAT
jgi:hypothetical protein